jgi:glutamate/tyrosine decarboxylase-like PLP-dependent enzyme
MAFKMRGYSAFTKKTDKKSKKEKRLTEAMPLQEGEMEGTYIPEGKISKQEIISDLEERIHFMEEDVHNGTKTQAEADKVIRELKKRIAYIRQNI